MKEWLSNKKNLPIVIVIVVLLVGGATAGILFGTGVIGGSNNASTDQTAANTPAAPSTTAAPPAAPAPPPAAHTPPPAPPAAMKMAGKAKMPAGAVKKVLVASAIRPKDPFRPAVTAAALEPPMPPVTTLVGRQIFTNLTFVPKLPGLNGESRSNAPVLVAINNVPVGRVSGVILSNGVHAIYESSGTSTIVQPGDQLPDGIGRVQSIQTDGLVVRLSGPGNRVVQIPISNGATQTQGPQAGPGGPANGAGAPPGAGNDI